MKINQPTAVTAQHECRSDEGTGWYAYVGNDCQGGPFETQRLAIDLNTLLCDATAEQLARFDAAARSAGHPSGRAVANEWSLWSMSVAAAIETVSDATAND